MQPQMTPLQAYIARTRAREAADRPPPPEPTPPEPVDPHPKVHGESAKGFYNEPYVPQAVKDMAERSRPGGVPDDQPRPAPPPKPKPYMPPRAPKPFG